jgi:hypothetical protein
MANTVVIKNRGDSYAEVIDNRLLVSSVTTNSLVPEEYDDIKLFYTNDDLTKVEYYKDSSLVATLDLSYSNGKLVEVSRS